jgi:predicted RND superfamily exporter protein
MSGAIDELSRRWVPRLIRRRRLVLSIAAVLTVLGASLSARLYGDLRSGIEELLPESALSVIAARTLAPRLRGTARLSVVLEGRDGAALRRFADDLVRQLRNLPPGMVESIQHRADEEQSFLRRYGLLYVSAEDLAAARDRIAARIAWEKRAANPLAIELDPESQPPPLDFSDLESRYGGPGRSGARFPDGYYQSRDGRLLVIQVRAPEASTGLHANEKLLRAVQKQVALLDPPSYDSRLRVGYSGEVAELVEEQAALVSDLAASTALVTALVLLVLWVFFRRWSSVAALLLSLFTGCAITFGLADLAVGHLNANTAFLASIVLGNGINVGIIVVARYLEERRNGADLEEAIRKAWAVTLPPTFVAAFGAGLAYLSLATTDFRGFSQFGGIGALGMALCWACAYLLLPPLLFVLDRGGLRAGVSRGQGRAFAWLGGLIEARPSAFLAAGAVILLACGAAVSGYRGDLLEHDASRLRSRRSLANGAVHWSEKTDLVFEAYLTPVVLWSDSPEGLTRVLAALDRRRAALGVHDPLREVISVESAVPGDQERKLAVLAQIRNLLDDRLVRRLDPNRRAQVLALRPPYDVRAMTFSDLPGDLRRALTERDGTVGRVALAFPRKVGGLNLDDVERMKDVVRGAFRDARGTALAYSPLLLLSDIDDAIWRDGPKASVVALLVVCFLVVLVARRPRPVATVIGSLLLGLAGLLGAAAAAHVRVNFLNFVVLPITLGIGVDYAINVVQRHRHEPDGSIARTLCGTGGAVALCSATTVIGYGSLMVADNQALAGFGLLAALGEVTCLFSALVILPAWLARGASAPRSSAGVAGARATFGASESGPAVTPSIR